MKAYQSQTLKNLLEKHLSKVLNGLTTTSIYLLYGMIQTLCHIVIKSILYLTKNGKIGVIKAIKSNNWDWYVSDKYSIVKWVYVDNLLPNSKQLKGDEK